MTIYKHYKATEKEYRHVHNYLRNKLNRIAFNNYYKCSVCGCHKDLEIHIPNCNPKLIDSPGFYVILCHKCHLNQKH